jgi:6-phosphogluconolactonase (cycloisomerase 2 family)
MKRNPGQLTLAGLALVCILALAACSSSTTPSLRFITISPVNSTISVKQTQQFTALAYYSDGTIKDGTGLVLWSSSNPAAATITANGLATGVAIGSTSILATAAGTAGATTPLTVNQLTSIAVTPMNPTVPLGATQQFDAMATFSDGTTSDITATATWSSLSANATVAAGGLATVPTTATVGGTAIIEAMQFGTNGQTTLTVGNAVAASLAVTPATPTIAVGQTQAFTAMEVYTDGTMHTPAGSLTWASGTAATATLAPAPNTNIAFALATGTSTITATEGTLTPGTATLTVAASNSRFAYVSNSGGTTVQWYSVAAGTSPYFTAPSTDTFTTPQSPTQTVIHPNGQFLYFTDLTPEVGVATITSGALASPTGTPIGSFTAPISGASGDLTYAVVDPYGRFLYVSDKAANTITGYTINSDGSLTAIAGSPFTANLNLPEFLTIDKTGTYLYATNNANATVSAYTMDPTTGVLTALSTPTFATGTGPRLGAWDPTGTYLFIANVTTNTVSAFSLGSGGLLTAVGTAPFTVTGATGIFNLVVDPSGSHIYVLDGGTTTTKGQVYGYSVAAGVIGTAITGSPWATGTSPSGGIVIDPTGVLLAVDNLNSNSISLFTVGTGGALTPVTPTTPTGASPLYVTLYNAH